MSQSQSITNKSQLKKNKESEIENAWAFMKPDSLSEDRLCITEYWNQNIVL